MKDNLQHCIRNPRFSLSELDPVTLQPVIVEEFIIPMSVPLIQDPKNPNLYTTGDGVIFGGVVDHFDTPIYIKYLTKVNATINTLTGFIAFDPTAKEEGFLITPCEGTDVEIYNLEYDNIVKHLKLFKFESVDVFYQVVGGERD